MIAGRSADFAGDVIRERLGLPAYGLAIASDGIYADDVGEVVLEAGGGDELCHYVLKMSLQHGVSPMGH